ncbi:uncharacterized protein PGTG_06874 [Puccinia graminis f. sp. tritici CRL 75-36-700-3]|uniref:Secreted protein n=1 Tax=Puccinia graminis f. sp. tritici (strain CRL 75-36-700-3 / race SCCL) TaxID=418459 RepID=E3KA96_PUCGT|nr:uncharacterized protein PGTG_06874 [Puccinia graminis f. sp. tritici CRL 75-36-700-3]EFP81253.2 hypothetical protein PGTG_06874 [Puccinia graminis f. sp. tritici CRL 75-36-700-3]
MKATTSLFFLAAVAMSAVMADFDTTPPHTTCYNHFLTTGKKCVYSSPNDMERCPAPPDPPKTSQSVPLFQHQISMNKRSEDHTLGRRYDTTKPVTTAVKMVFTCPEPQNPDPNDDSSGLGVCLWVGANCNSTGWVNKDNFSNCGKQLYIQRKGDIMNPKYPRVIGGCDFGPDLPNEVGCFNLAVNQKLFDAFNPTEEERSTGVLSNIMTWDFNNLKGSKKQNGPN